MSQNVPTPQIYGTLLELARELKDFADTSGLKAAFDVEGNAYIEGNGFIEQLQKENLVRNNELRAEIRGIIAKHCPRVQPSYEQ